MGPTPHPVLSSSSPLPHLSSQGVTAIVSGHVEQHKMTLKDGVVISFVLGLWLYSIYLMFRAWRKILNFSDDQLRRPEKASLLWKWLMEHIVSARKERKNGEDSEAGSDCESKEKDEVSESGENGTRSSKRPQPSGSSISVDGDESTPDTLKAVRKKIREQNLAPLSAATAAVIIGSAELAMLPSSPSLAMRNSTHSGGSAFHPQITVVDLRKSSAEEDAVLSECGYVSVEYTKQDDQDYPDTRLEYDPNVNSLQDGSEHYPGSDNSSIHIDISQDDLRLSSSAAQVATSTYV